MENPAYDDEFGDGKTKAETHGDGDGDDDSRTTETDGDLPTGDGDEEAESTTTGDGDGDEDTTTTTTGDGDGDQTCFDGLTWCDGGCMTLKNNHQNCGECGNACGNVEVCGVDQCLAKKYVFVTSTKHQGNLKLQASPDNICAERAIEAGLPGLFRAWMASSNVPLDLSPGGAYLLRNGPVVAWSWPDLISGELLAPINRDEYGDLLEPWSVEGCELDHAVWTGTNHSGVALADNCEGWQSNYWGNLGRVGNAEASDFNWSASECKAPCDAELPLYCIAQ